MDIAFIYDESDEDKIEKFNELTSSDVINAFTNRFLDFKSMWKNVFGDNYAFKVGDGIKDRLKEHKEQENPFMLIPIIDSIRYHITSISKRTP